MNHIGQQIEFSSAAFPPCTEDEEELVNHETMHGYALARYIADRLPEHGFELERMVGEDWGWWCEVKNEGFTLAYGCSSYDRTEDFILFVTPDKPRVRRWFKSIDVSQRVEALNEALFAILATSGKASKGPSWVG
jgi:hypothetical protein